MNKKIGIFPGAFKPPHKGHYQAAVMASNENDIVYVLISNGERDGVTAYQAFEIWELFKQTIPNLDIKVSKGTPVRDAYELVDRLNQSVEAPDITINLYSDAEDMSRFDRMEKFGENLKVINRKVTPRIASATQLRQIIAKGNQKAFINFYPTNIKTGKIWKMLTVKSRQKSAS